MANHKLQLMTFLLSSKESPLSLSTSSMAFISKVPPPRRSSDELHHLLESKQLWLLSSGLCRMEVIVDTSECQIIRPDSRLRFLEYIADAVCQCSVWSTLGLIVNQLAIHDKPLDGDPNLYFSIEHPDKSYGLLSPTHVPAVYFQGLEFLLHFHSEYGLSASHDNDNLDDFRRNDRSQDSNGSQGHEFSAHHHTPEDVLMDPSADTHTNMLTNQFQHGWSFAAHLVQAALHTTIGVKRPRGLQLLKENSNTLPLLKIAPSIWNAHYLQLTAAHSKNFPIISNILSTSLHGQSPTLRRKATELVENDDGKEQGESSAQESGKTQLIGSSIQRRLWGLLQTNLEPKVRTRGIASYKNITLSPEESYERSLEMLPMFPSHFYYSEEYIGPAIPNRDFELSTSWPISPTNNRKDDNMALDTLEDDHVQFEEDDVDISDEDMVYGSILQADDRLELDQDLGSESYTPEDMVYEEGECYYFHDDLSSCEVDYHVDDGDDDDDDDDDDECTGPETIPTGDPAEVVVERWYEFQYGSTNTLWESEFEESEAVR
ncbi:hypothetical protein F4810DRAFT_174998 [Camillea tinctor]|nr:hypothetical protein F4810DRAFT_174998 [Camillea tinctor]